MEKFLKWRV